MNRRGRWHGSRSRCRRFCGRGRLRRRGREYERRESARQTQSSVRSAATRRRAGCRREDARCARGHSILRQTWQPSWSWGDGRNRAAAQRRPRDRDARRRPHRRWWFPPAFEAALQPPTERVEPEDRGVKLRQPRPVAIARTHVRALVCQNGVQSLGRPRVGVDRQQNGGAERRRTANALAEAHVVRRRHRLGRAADAPHGDETGHQAPEQQQRDAQVDSDGHGHRQQGDSSCGTGCVRAACQRSWAVRTRSRNWARGSSTAAPAVPGPRAGPFARRASRRAGCACERCATRASGRADQQHAHGGAHQDFEHHFFLLVAHARSFPRGAAARALSTMRASTSPTSTSSSEPLQKRSTMRFTARAAARPRVSAAS